MTRALASRASAAFARRRALEKNELRAELLSDGDDDGARPMVPARAPQAAIPAAFVEALTSGMVGAPTDHAQFVMFEQTSDAQGRTRTRYMRSATPDTMSWSFSTGEGAAQGELSRPGDVVVALFMLAVVLCLPVGLVVAWWGAVFIGLAVAAAAVVVLLACGVWVARTHRQGVGR